MSSIPDASTFRTQILDHFRTHARDLPWRTDRTPYSIWLSEIMLQQTTVAAVIDYYNRFLAHFPTLEDLANANLEDVLHLWQGLGYYSRARNLHKCAKELMQNYNGTFPQTAAELQKLPGIGPYTSAAIASIAFHENVAVVDGNIERVISRIYQIKTPLPKSKPEIKEKVAALTSPDHPGMFAEAMMDLGATICTPKNPKCGICPLQNQCRAYAASDAEDYPKKLKKTAKPNKAGAAFIISNPENKLYMHKRPSTGLLAELWEVPSLGWEKEDSVNRLPTPLQQQCRDLLQTAPSGTIRHIFTHFNLTLDVYELHAEETEEKGWFKEENLPPTPNLMKKVLNLKGQS
jgi:A/G-specific adenine glycosylase